MSGDTKEPNPAEDAAKDATKTAVKAAVTAGAATLGIPPVVADVVVDKAVDKAANKASEAMSEGPKPDAGKSDKKEGESSAPTSWAASMAEIQDRATEQAKEMGADKLLYNPEEGGKSGLRQGLSAVSSGLKALQSMMGPATPTSQTTELSTKALSSLPKSLPKPGGGDVPGVDLDQVAKSSIGPK